MKPNVLIVEDDLAIMTVLAEVLSMEGYRVRTAMNGRDALVAASAKAPDIVLSDIGLPFVDGHGVALSMRRRGIPVVLMSASNFSGSTYANAFLRKPFDLDVLVATVDRILAEPRKRGGHRCPRWSRFNGAFHNWRSFSHRGSRQATLL
ncbi:MAG: response regulator transcription factor [Thermomicrobiales bacterium]